MGGGETNSIAQTLVSAWADSQFHEWNHPDAAKLGVGVDGATMCLDHWFVFGLNFLSRHRERRSSRRPDRATVAAVSAAGICESR